MCVSMCFSCWFCFSGGPLTSKTPQELMFHITFFTAHKVFPASTAIKSYLRA